MSQQSFADLGVSSAVCASLTERGFTEPFAIQRKVIGDVLAGRDVLAKSPTGSGKTLAFMVPIIDRIEATDRRPAALILAPTRELATQIVEASYPIAHARALKVRAVYGGVGIEKQAREARSAHIVVATPGRLEDLIGRGDLSLGHVKILVLDEADRMLDMGFRPPVDRIVAQCPADRQTLFFSATLDGEAGEIAREYTRGAVTHEHVPPVQKTADIEHRFVPRRGRRPHRHAADASCAAPSTSWRSCSCAPSAAPTGSSSAWATRATRRSRCTATRASASARRRSPSSSPAASTRSSRPTSPRAASTSTASRTSSTSIRRRTARATSTASAAPAARAAPASASPSSAASTLADMSKIARELELEREYAASGHSPADVARPAAATAAAATAAAGRSTLRAVAAPASAGGRQGGGGRARRAPAAPERLRRSQHAHEQQAAATAPRQRRRRGRAPRGRRGRGRERLDAARARDRRADPPRGARVRPRRGRRASRVSAAASSGRAMWKPWPGVAAERRDAVQRAAPSRGPSATTTQPRLWPSSIVERMIARSRSSASIRAANERSILISSIGSSRSRLSDE